MMRILAMIVSLGGIFVGLLFVFHPAAQVSPGQARDLLDFLIEPLVVFSSARLLFAVLRSFRIDRRQRSS